MYDLNICWLWDCWKKDNGQRKTFLLMLLHLGGPHLALALASLASLAVRALAASPLAPVQLQQARHGSTYLDTHALCR